MTHVKDSKIIHFKTTTISPIFLKLFKMMRGRTSLYDFDQGLTVHWPVHSTVSLQHEHCSHYLFINDRDTPTLQSVGMQCSPAAQ